MKEILSQKLLKIMEQLTTEDIFEARQYRNWEEFDQLTELEKLEWRLQEFEIFEDILNF